MMDTESDYFTQSPLGYLYWAMRAEKYNHKVALWAAWAAHKADKKLLAAVGLPDTQKELAETLGVTARTIRNYRVKHGEALEAARSIMVDNLLSQYLPDAIEAMGKNATDPTKNGTSDRRLLFEMAGVFTPKQKTDLTSGGQPIEPTFYFPENRRDGRNGEG